MGRTLKDKARTGRPEHERTWTLHFNVEEAEDRELWDWLRTLPGSARQYLVKQAIRAGRGRMHSAPAPAPDEGADETGPFEL
jgi:hypothetical protein